MKANQPPPAYPHARLLADQKIGMFVAANARATPLVRPSNPNDRSNSSRLELGASSILERASGIRASIHGRPMRAFLAENIAPFAASL